MRTRLLCASALALLALGSPLLDGARGYVAPGRAWPGGVIRYYNAATDQRWAVQRAVDAWNSSGAGVHFVAVPSSQAEVRIEHFQGVPCTVNAEATVGYGQNARVYVFQRDERSPYCNSRMAARALAHELGHVLGLDHETRGCSLMNPTGTLQGPSMCPKAKLWQWRCRLLTGDDVAGAVALYGGTIRPQSGSRNCDLYTGMRTPTGVMIASTAVTHEYQISFRRPPSVAVPGFLSTQSDLPESFVAAAVPDRCPTDPRRFTRHTWDAKPGEVEHTYLDLGPGTYCLSVWGVDSFSRPSPKPAQLWVKIT